jgi:hypothetical protein
MDTALWICIGISLAMNIIMLFLYYFIHRIPERTDLMYDEYKTWKRQTKFEVEEMVKNSPYHRSRMGNQDIAIHQHDNFFKTLQPLIAYINHKNMMQKRADLDAADKAKLAELKKAVGELLK